MRQSTPRRRIFRPVILSAGTAALILLTASLNSAQEPPPTEGGTRQPIVENQFTTTTGGALQARAPGNYIQQAVAVQEGELIIPGEVPDDTPWVRETFDLLFLQFVDIIIQLVETVTGFVGGNPLAGLLGSSGDSLGGLLSNPLTGGTGSTSIQ